MWTHVTPDIPTQFNDDIQFMFQIWIIANDRYQIPTNQADQVRAYLSTTHRVIWNEQRWRGFKSACSSVINYCDLWSEQRRTAPIA